MSVLSIDNEDILLPSVRKFDGHDWFSTKTSRRNLPHWELKGSTYFITTRVDSELNKPFLNPSAAKLMVNVLIQKEKEHYELQAFVVMPDHLHLLLKPLWNKSLSEIMKHLKGTSAYQLNKLLNRRGNFWQAENFDHLIRNTLDLQGKWDYIKENPVKARLVKEAENYPFSSFYHGLKPVKTSAD